MISHNYVMRKEDVERISGTRPIVLDRAQPHQLPFIKTMAPKAIAYGGFGSGKTWAGVDRALKCAIGFPGSDGFIGGISWSKHLEPLIIPMFIELLPEPYKIDVKLGKFMAEIRGPGIDPKHPSKLWFFGMGNKGSHTQFITRQFDYAYIDEAVDVSEQTFEFVVSRLRKPDPRDPQKRRPGWLFVTTHTEDEGHWLKLHAERQKWAQFRMATNQNTKVPLEYIQDMQESYQGAMAERYIEGHWVSLKGRMFEYGKRQIWEGSLPPFERIVLAVDPASAEKGDYWVAMVCGLTKENDLFVVDLIRNRGYDILEQIKEIEILWRRWKPNQSVVESNGYSEQLQRTGARWVPSLEAAKVYTNKETRAMAVAGAYSNGKVFWALADLSLQEEAIREVCAFPGGKNDDVVDALSMCYNFIMGQTDYYTGDFQAISRR